MSSLFLSLSLSLSCVCAFPAFHLTASWETINSPELFHQLLDHSPILSFCTRVHPNPSILRLLSFVHIVMVDSPACNSYLTSNKLSGTIPTTIGSLTNLLDLYEIHPSSWKKIEVTDCSVGYDYGTRELFFNQLSGTIPSTIGSLTNLQFLYESHPHL